MSRGTVLVLVALVAALALGGCAADATPTVSPMASPIPSPMATPAGTPAATPTPGPTYPGRLLFIDHLTPGELNPVSVLALGSDTRGPVNVGTAQLSGEIVGWSDDGARLVANDGTLAVLGAGTEALPAAGAGIRVATFSPDGTSVAYDTDDGGVVVYDLAARTHEVVLQTPCAYYGSDTQLCGIADGVIWIDPTTLFVHHFAGQMPKVVRCTDASSSICYPPEANTYSIVTTSGQIVAGMPGTAKLVLGRGDTIVLAGGTWLSLEAVRAGTATPNELPAGALAGSLSPDGLQVTVPGDPWQLVDLRTGAAQVLGTRTQVPDPTQNWLGERSAWSPDRQLLAAPTYDNTILIVPVSEASGWIGGSFPEYATLIAWAP